MLLSACDKTKRKYRLYFLLPSVVSPNTKPIQQGSLHHTVQASTCLLVCDTFKIIWRFSEGTKVRSKHFFRLCQYVLICYISLKYWFGAKLIKKRQTMKQMAVILKNLHGNSLPDILYHANRYMANGCQNNEKFSETACV